MRGRTNGQFPWSPRRRFTNLPVNSAPLKKKKLQIEAKDLFERPPLGSASGLVVFHSSEGVRSDDSDSA